MARKMGKQACQIRLDGELTVYNAAELKPGLLGQLDECAEVEVDLSQVTEFDSAGLQLLILLKREAMAAGKGLRLAQHSPVVVEVLDLCNLGAFFGDPVVLTSARG